MFNTDSAPAMSGMVRAHTAPPAALAAGPACRHACRHRDMRACESPAWACLPRRDDRVSRRARPHAGESLQVHGKPEQADQPDDESAAQPPC